jgi:hypothetical protein
MPSPSHLIISFTDVHNNVQVPTCTVLKEPVNGKATVLQATF